MSTPFQNKKIAGKDFLSVQEHLLAKTKGDAHILHHTLLHVAKEGGAKAEGD